MPQLPTGVLSIRVKVLSPRANFGSAKVATVMQVSMLARFDAKSEPSSSAPVLPPGLTPFGGPTDGLGHLNANYVPAFGAALPYLRRISIAGRPHSIRQVCALVEGFADRLPDEVYRVLRNQTHSKRFNGSSRRPDRMQRRPRACWN
jgi:hypothetical protein